MLPVQSRTRCSVDHGCSLERLDVTYRRNLRREGCGTIYLEHPDDSAHNCSVDLPLPDDPAAQRRIETEIRMRVGWSQAA
jgi:hypothetical protein